MYALRNDWLDFSKPFFELVNVDLVGLNFGSMGSGEQPHLSVTFSFWGVRRTSEFTMDDVSELATMSFWDIIGEIFYYWADTLFRIPDCFTDINCYEWDKDECVEECDENSYWIDDYDIGETCPTETDWPDVFSWEFFWGEVGDRNCFAHCYWFKCQYEGGYWTVRGRERLLEVEGPERRLAISPPSTTKNVQTSVLM